jgi:CelD/BcsL family acetyltransferase involved in cellulose biosynthesis
MSHAVEDVSAPAEFAALSNDWNRLVRLEGDGVTGFDSSASFEWATAVWATFPESRPDRVLVARGSDNGALGILPCRITPDTLAHVTYRRLTPTSGIYDLRTGLLVAGNADVLRSLVQHALRHVPGWDALHVHMVEGGPTASAVADCARSLDLTLWPLAEWRTPYIQLPEDPADTAMTASPKLRSNVRRAERQLQRLGTLEMRVFSDSVDAQAFVELMVDVEARSWKMPAGTAMQSSTQQLALYRSLTPALARAGQWLGAALYIDGRAIAFMYGFRLGRVFVDEKESFDAQFAEYGPGNVLKLRAFPEWIRRGIAIHDYGGREDPHKARWTDRLYARQTALLLRRGARSRLLEAALRLRHRLGLQAAPFVP